MSDMSCVDYKGVCEDLPVFFMVTIFMDALRDLLFIFLF